MSFGSKLQEARLHYLERHHALTKELQHVENELKSLESMRQGWEQALLEQKQAAEAAAEVPPIAPNAVPSGQP